MLSTQPSHAVHPPALPSGDASADPIEARFDPAAMPARMAAALDAMRLGIPVVVLDDADRENEADLIIAADRLTHAGMAMLIRECSGIVCLCLTAEKAACWACARWWSTTAASTALPSRYRSKRVSA